MKPRFVTIGLALAVTGLAHAAPLHAGDGVVLAAFKNATGDPVFDGTLDFALRDELGASPFVNVIAANRDGLPPEAGGALAACAQRHGSAVITGEIVTEPPGYTVTLSAVSCDRGERFAETHAVAADRGGVLNALSRALTALRLQLGEPAASVTRFAVPVEATTSSLDALKAYSTAVADSDRSGGPPAIPLFNRVVALDPSFPLSYAALSTIYHNLQEPTLALRYAADAFRLRNRATERERLRVSAAYFLATGQLDQEVRNYHDWQTAYPRDFLPYNDLGNDYAAMGRLDNALAQYRKGLQLNPTLIGYVNVGGMYVSLDRFAEASTTFEEALANNFDGRYLRMNFYWLAFLQGDTSKMAAQMTWASSHPQDEDALLSLESDTEAYHGHIQWARELSRRAVEYANRNGSKETAALWRVNQALREAEVGESSSARQDAVGALALSSDRDVTIVAALTMARSGEATQAQLLANRLQHDYADDSLMKLYWLPVIRAAIALEYGNGMQARADLEPVEPYDLGTGGTFISYLYPAYLRGLAYRQMHRGTDAAAEFQKLIDHRGITLNFVTGALAYEQRARSYTCAGDVTKAKAEYERFFDIWKSADKNVPVLSRARAAYARLSRTSGYRCAAATAAA